MLIIVKENTNEKCLGIYPWVNKEQQQKDPTQETTQLIHLKHWTPLDQRPSKSIKTFPTQFI
jgi:hypothetical protein